MRKIKSRGWFSDALCGVSVALFGVTSGLYIGANAWAQAPSAAVDGGEEAGDKASANLRAKAADVQEPSPGQGTELTPVPNGGSDYEASKQASDFSRELRSVEQDVDSLKERVFRSKATLQLLRELVLEGNNTGTRIALLQLNKLGPAYTLESAQYFLDGKNVYSRIDSTGALDRQTEIDLVQQVLSPGTHNLQVSLVLRGNGFGVFSYLDAYSFKVQSSFSFTVEEGLATTVKVVVNERGGPLRAFVDRPGIDYLEKTEREKEPG